MNFNGTVSNYSDSKGYGFIQVDNEQYLAFVHYTSILEEGYKSLTKGDRVSFKVVDGPINKIALEVRKIS